jgi:hypothetical protein
MVKRLMPMLLRAAHVSIGCVLGLVPYFATADFYVSDAGDDRKSGTQQEPFRTLERAREAVRRDRQQHPDIPITVWIAGGTYELSRSFELGPNDSGRRKAPVSYRALSQQQVRLLGGRRLPASGFTKVTDQSVLRRIDPVARENVVQFDLKAFGISDVGKLPPSSQPAELFFNDRALLLARWPNDGFVRIVQTAGNEPLDVRGIKGDKVGVFIYEGDRPSRWIDETDLWLHGYWFWDWADEYQRVRAIDIARKTIALDPPYHHYGYRAGMRYYAVNVLAELDQPGEWYLDRQKGVLYLWPPAALDNSRVVLSVIKTPLVVLSDASYIILRDLIIEGSRGAGVVIRGGEGNLVDHCTVRNVGGQAVVVVGGVRHSVRGCDIYQTGQGGIALSGGDRRSLAPGEHAASNNHIHHFARLQRTYAPAIKLEGVGNRVAQNLIHDSPHMAIGFSGNDHIMELNEVHSVCYETADVGAFYTGRDWTARGNVIRHNYIHDIKGVAKLGAQAIYLDDAASGTLVYGNLIYATDRAMLIGGGRENVVENNMMIECDDSIVFDNRGLNWMREAVTPPDGVMVRRLLDVPYVKSPWLERYPRLANLLSDQPGAPKYNTVRSNVTYHCGAMRLSNEVINSGTVQDNIQMDQDPGFIDLANRDFRLRPDSLLRRKLPSFETIPIRKIGLQR